MNKIVEITFILIFAFSTLGGIAQTNTNSSAIHVITDRDYCLSGDSVWFSLVVPNNLSKTGNVVHVQLDNQNNNLISKVITNEFQGKHNGFIHIPDSLSTGVYFISAFLNEQKNTLLKSKAMLVFNRFEESLSEITIPKTENKIEYNKNKKVEIYTNKKNYTTREKVALKINTRNLKMKHAMVKAVLQNPITGDIVGDYLFKVKHPDEIPSLQEKSGFLIHGIVTDETGIPQANKLVILSIPGKNSYFDYYYSGEKGDFNFYIKNARGTANIVLQAISDDNKLYQIKLQDNYLQRKENFTLENKILTSQQTEFTESFLNGKYIDKIFNPVNPVFNESFEMPARFTLPFYGNPDFHIKPEEFIDLPDFREISRELLPGVQYRIKNEEVTFRMLNGTRGKFFENEPLKLLNGIPIFNNSLLANLKSTDIEYIDIVQRERMFGDLIFNGVLSVKLRNMANSWLAQQPNVFQFKVNCFQPKANPGYKSQQIKPVGNPDMRQVFLWEQVNNNMGDFEFYLSDFKGKIEIIVEGVLQNNEAFKTSEIINVN